MMSIALAQVDIGEKFGSPFSSIGELISALLPNIYMLAGIILFILLIGGGFGIIISAGRGEKEGVAKGGKAVTAALIGFLVIIASYWIIQIISVVTGLNILNPPELGS
jgi:hypothetical protein